MRPECRTVLCFGYFSHCQIAAPGAAVPGLVTTVSATFKPGQSRSLIVYSQEYIQIESVVELLLLVELYIHKVLNILKVWLHPYSQL